MIRTYNQCSSLTEKFIPDLKYDCQYYQKHVMVESSQKLKDKQNNESLKRQRVTPKNNRKK